MALIFLHKKTVKLKEKTLSTDKDCFLNTIIILCESLPHCHTVIIATKKLDTDLKKKTNHMMFI